MADIQQFINEIREVSSRSSRRKITGKNALVKDLFEFVFKRANLKYDLLVLCTKKGLLLDCFSPELDRDLSGYTISPDVFYAQQEHFIFNDSLEEFLLISSLPEEFAPLANQLQSNLKMLLGIYDVNKGREQYLLDCLDAVENAICIYDKDANLLYANKAHCENLHIFDKEAAIGMNILDITKQSGIKIHATKNGSDSLKMMDVLKSGKKTLDWEVMIESQTFTNKAQFVSNNMYPIKNKSGQVEGMVEIAYSHQLSLNKTKKIMGLTAEYTFDSIVGSSPAITEKIQQAKEYASSPYNLLIVGESGVGKELFAQSIHNYSERRQEPFVALNCASFPENLIESELFGYVGGAFTGASKTGQIGKFELADGGTLFLDEIGELPYHFQSKLLRVLETRKITRIGSSNETPVNVRVVAATNRDLEQMISEGLFRQDLYYRLQVLNIDIPPLRKRREDLLLLTETFLKEAADANGDEPKVLDSDAQKCLMEYEWPGNVRELRNVIHRITLLSKINVVSKDILEAAIYSKGYRLKPESNETPEVRLNKRRMDVDHSYANLINEALEITKGNKKQAADLLGVSRKTFYRMIEKYC
ncbi:sigma-54 interaction domain-containing protein [Aminipila luticellarii]|uniref:AAA family ATPase n=1 Tax=Aminipila luticellarii TaxID=2507160 RepID=A0A410PWJ9_9FIRM|nr:sigma 54-interacting transcriptional regulator [Aminipila luticellarii]QAT43270.1 AAA family ATPase [Aminipila luticellarii]